MAGYVPTAEMAAAAKRGLELRKEHKRGGTSVGVARAKQLIGRQELSADTVMRMVSYFARHAVDKQGKDWNNNSAGYIAWLLWGGDSGRTWANKMAKKIKGGKVEEHFSSQYQHYLLLEEAGVVNQIEPQDRSVERINNARNFAKLKLAIRVALANTKSLQEQLAVKIADTDFKVAGGWVSDDERINRNNRQRINAEVVELLKKPSSELSEADKEKIRKYSGWGGTSAQEAGRQYDFYTAPTVALAQAQLANKLRAFQQGDKLLEPSCGGGVFFDIFPDGMEMTGVELDERTAGVAQRLHGDRVDVQNKAFELFNIENEEEFDAVVGNAPFGQRDPHYQQRDDPEEGNLDRYFLKRALRKLKAGRVMCLQVSDGVFRSQRNKDFRLDLMFLGKFMGALRLTNEAYRHSGSQFASPDILIFLRHEEPFKKVLQGWIESSKMEKRPDKAQAREEWDENMRERKMTILQACNLYNDHWHNGSREYYQIRRNHMLGVEKEIPMRGFTTEGSLTASKLDMAVGRFRFEHYEDPNLEAIKGEVEEYSGRMEQRELEIYNADTKKLEEGEFDKFYCRCLRVGDTKVIDNVVYVLDEESGTTVANSRPYWKVVKGGDKESHRAMMKRTPKIMAAQSIAAMVDQLQTTLYENGNVGELQKSIFQSLKNYEDKYKTPLFLDPDLIKVQKRYPFLSGLTTAMTLQIKAVPEGADHDPECFAPILHKTSNRASTLYGSSFDGMSPELRFLRLQRAKYVGGMSEALVRQLAGEDMVKAMFESKYVMATVNAGQTEPVFILKEDFMNGLVADLESTLRLGIETAPDENWKQKFQESLSTFHDEKPYTPKEDIDIFLSASYVPDDVIQEYIDETLNYPEFRRQNDDIENDDYDGRKNIGMEFWITANTERNPIDFVGHRIAGYYEQGDSLEEITDSLGNKIQIDTSSDVQIRSAFFDRKKVQTKQVRILLRDKRKDGQDYVDIAEQVTQEKKAASARGSDSSITEFPNYPRGFTLVDCMQQPFLDEILIPALVKQAEIQAGGTILPESEVISRAKNNVPLPPDFKGYYDDSRHSQWGEYTNVPVAIDDVFQEGRKNGQAQDKLFSTSSGTDNFRDKRIREVLNLTRMLNGVSITAPRGKKGESKKVGQLYKRRFFNGFNNKFKGYVDQNPEVQQEIADRYNEINNSLVEPSGASYPIEIKGWNGEYPLTEVQWATVHHLLRNQRGIGALGVGFGKTFAAVALTGVLIQEKKAKRIWVQVPNNKVKDWAEEYGKGLPAFKVEWITPEIASSPAQRFKKYNQMAQSMSEVVIFPDSMAVEVQLTPENDDKVSEILYQDQTKNATHGTSDQIASWIRYTRSRLDTSADRTAAITFEAFGCDAIVTDEAHNYKNLFDAYAVSTAISQVDTVNTSTRGIILLKKYEYLRMRNGNDQSNCFALTATPMSNSPLEFYNMLYHVNPSALRDNGLDDMAAFVNQFCNIVQKEKIASDGVSIEVAPVLEGFRNLDLLRKVFFEVTYFENRREKLEQGENSRETGRSMIAHDVIVDAGPEQTDMIIEIRQKLKIWRERPQDVPRNADGSPEREWHRLYLRNKLLSISVDAELVDPTIDAVNLKLKALQDNVRKHMSDPASATAGQLIFCDRHNVNSDVPNPNKKTFHQKIKDYLTDPAKGGFFAPNEVQIVNGDTMSGKGKTANERQASLDKLIDQTCREFNEGKVRVLIGNTPCMGEGVNLQRNSIAVHHLDIPYRPSDFIQRNGRVDRQGNQQMTTHVYNYRTRGTLDGLKLQIVLNKQNWIEQLLRGNEKIFENPEGMMEGSSPLEIELALAESSGDTAAVAELQQAVNIMRHEQQKANNIAMVEQYFQAFAAAQMSLMQQEAGTEEYQNTVVRINRLKDQLNANPEWHSHHLTGEKMVPFVTIGNTKQLSETAKEAPITAIFKGEKYYVYDRGMNTMGKESMFTVTGFAPSAKPAGKIMLEADHALRPKKKVLDKETDKMVDDPKEADKPLRGFIWASTTAKSENPDDFTKRAVRLPVWVKSFDDIQAAWDMTVEELYQQPPDKAWDLLYLRNLQYNNKDDVNQRSYQQTDVIYQTKRVGGSSIGGTFKEGQSSEVRMWEGGDSEYDYCGWYSHRKTSAKSMWHERLKPFSLQLTQGQESVGAALANPFGQVKRRDKRQFDHLGLESLNLPQAGSPLGLRNVQEIKDGIMGLIRANFGHRPFYIQTIAAGSNREVANGIREFAAEDDWKRLYLDHFIALIHNYNFSAVHQGDEDEAEDRANPKARMRGQLYRLWDGNLDRDLNNQLLNMFEDSDYELPDL